MALDGGEDGLDFYRNLAGEWKNALSVGGQIFLEVGIGQADDVLRHAAYPGIRGFGDHQGPERHPESGPRHPLGEL